jgi:hypothetical protein
MLQMPEQLNTWIRTLAVAAGLVASAVFGSAALSKDPGAYGFTLQLVPSQNAVQPGEPVWKEGNTVFVLVMAVNNSDRTVHYSLTNPWSDWEMDVRDEAGKPVPETEEFRKLKQNRAGSLTYGRNILVTLKPHESGQDTIEVSYAYNLSSAGKYFIQVRREFPEIGKAPVESNRLEIKIVR